MTLPIQSPLPMSDYGDRLLIISFDNIIYPVPTIYYVSLLQSVCQEVKYDKKNSNVSTFHKKLVLYDKATQQLLAFSGSNALVVDSMDFTQGIYQWRTTSFTPSVL